MTYTNGNGTAVHTAESAPKRLRQLLVDEKKIIVAPGVYDGFSARIALEVGFDAIYMVKLFPMSELLQDNENSLTTTQDGSRNMCFKTRTTRSWLRITQ
jgi:hypothetical protein